jgi:hypothetical protein
MTSDVIQSAARDSGNDSKLNDDKAASTTPSAVTPDVHQFAVRHCLSGNEVSGDESPSGSSGTGDIDETHSLEGNSDKMASASKHDGDGDNERSVSGKVPLSVDGTDASYKGISPQGFKAFAKNVYKCNFDEISESEVEAFA